MPQQPDPPAEAAQGPPTRHHDQGQRVASCGAQWHPLDYSDIYERFIDLWQEARLAIWRAKHSKAGIKQWNAEEGRDVLTFGVDEKLVLAAIDTTRAVLYSLVKLRREMGPETGIPRWAIERIECALRNHPAALKALLKELAAEEE